MQGREPLIRIVIKLHAVALLPVVKRATKLYHLEAGASVVEFEGVSWFLIHDTIEFWRDYATFIGLVARLSSKVHIVQLIQVVFLRTYDLFNDIDRCIRLWVPLGEKGLGRSHLFVIDVNFITKTTELL